MTDPISVAETTVGGISLGLKICQGLLSYYQFYKSCSDQLNHLHVKLDNLKFTLETLQVLLQTSNSSNTSVIVNVTHSIAFCETDMNKLRAYLDKCKINSSPQGIKEKFQKSVQQTAFPFREKTLNEMKNTVKDLQENLNTALHELEMCENLL
jgi:ribosomal protein L29